LLLRIFLYVYAAIGAINIIRLTECAFWTDHQSTRGLGCMAQLYIDYIYLASAVYLLLCAPTIWTEIYLPVNI
jgi:hypothetical protein